MNNDYSPNTIGQTQYDYTTPYQEEPKKNGLGKSCLTGCGCGCLVLILALLIGGFLIYRICVKGSPLIVSPETTIITEPLKSDGVNVDFFKAISEKIEPKIAVEENGFRDVLAAYGKAVYQSRYQSHRGGLERDWHYEETCKKLGLDPANAASARFELPDEYLRVPLKSDPKTLRNRLATAPWSLNDQPEMKDWLDAVGPGLDIVRQSAMKEHYFVPMVRRNDKEPSFLWFSPEALAFHAPLAEALQIRAMQRLEEGQTEEAWKDALAALRLRRFVLAGLDFSQAEIPDEIRNSRNQAQIQAHLESRSLQQAVESLFSASPIPLDSFAKHGGWTKEQLDAAMTDLESLPEWTDRKVFLQALQFSLLDMLAAMNNTRQLTESLSGKAEGKEVPVPFMHWGLVAKTMNAYFKAYETEFVDRAVAEDTPAEPLDVMSKKFGQEFELTMKTAIEADPSKIFTVSGRSQVVGELLGRLAPMLEKMIHQEQGNEDGRTQTLRVALALERYKLETKSYPDSLDVLELRELEPALSLQYEKTETGYLLTSGETEIQR